MSSWGTQQMSQGMWGWVCVRSFTFYKLDKGWILGDVMSDIVRRLDDVVRERWEELYSPGYDEEVLGEIEQELNDTKERLG